jgi:hypothetical protein
MFVELYGMLSYVNVQEMEKKIDNLLDIYKASHSNNNNVNNYLNKRSLSIKGIVFDFLRIEYIVN